MEFSKLISIYVCALIIFMRINFFNAR